jgi:hypothetical protein
MRARIGIAVLALAELTACASASPTPTSSASAAGISEETCPSIDLRSLSGAPLDLTGRWRGLNGATYYVRQFRSCIWLTGFSVGTGVPGGEGTTPYTNALFGYLESDFTIRGAWADMPWGEERGLGTATLQIAFDEVDGVEAVTLSVIAASGGTSDLVIVLPEDRAELTVQLRDVGGCPVVQSEDGAEYEMIVGVPGWSVTDPPALLGPGGARIRQSDTFQVSGDLARGRGTCATGWILIADQIEVAAAP